MPGDGYTGGNGQVPPLRSIYYNPVGGCNLHCKHCWVDPDVDRPGHDPFAQRDRCDDELTAEQFFKILDDAKKLGLGHVKFTGGEPFLRRDTIDMMEGTVERKLGITVETNGTLLDEATIERLAKLKPSQVAVSIDSAEAEYHDRFRRAKGAHARTLEATHRLVAAGCRVQIIMAVTRENVGGCGALIRLARSVGVGSVKLCPVVPVGRGRGQEAGEQLAARAVLGLHGRFCGRDEQRIRVYVELPAAFVPLPRLRYIRRCRILTLLGLLPNGDVSYCGIAMGYPDLVMGDLLRDRLDAVWREHPRLLELRDGLPNRLEGICSECTMKGVCLGVCRAHALVMKGSIFSPHWFCEQAAREGSFPEKRRLSRESVCLPCV